MGLRSQLWASLWGAVLLWLVGPFAAHSAILRGDLSHLLPREVTRLQQSADFLEKESKTPVCVVLADYPDEVGPLSKGCETAIVLGAIVSTKKLVMDVPRASILAKKLDEDTAKAIQGRDMMPLLRRGKGADGLINGLDGLSLVLQGKYGPQPPGWLKYTWPLILVFTIILLLFIARQGRGNAAGDGFILSFEGEKSDLHLGEAATIPGTKTEVRHAVW